MPVVIIPSGASSTAGVSLLTLRQRLADELGFYHGTTATATVANGDAARVMLVEELRDDEAGYELPGSAVWVYVRTGAQAGAQRRVLLQDGYLGNYGGLRVSRPFGAALASGSAIEVTSPLPVKRTGLVKGLNDCINEALFRLPVEARISFTGNGTDQQALTTYPWLTNEDQILGLYDRASTVNASDAMGPSPYGFRLASNGATHTLVTERRYSAADTFEAAIVVEGDRLIYDGATWAYATTPGLTSDSHRAAAPEHWVLAFAMVKALQQLEKMVWMRNGVERQARIDAVTEIQRRRATWALAAQRIALHEFPRPAQKRSTPILSGTSTTEPTNGGTWSSWPA